MRISPGTFAVPAVAAFVCLLASPIPAQQPGVPAADNVIMKGGVYRSAGAPARTSSRQ